MIPVGFPERSFVAKFPSVADDARLDQLDLPEQVRLAGLDLVGLRVAVPGRPALEHVGDVDLGALEADAGEQLVEQLPGLTDERDALLVLVEAGRLADEHQVGVRIPDAEDDLRASLGEPAAGAARDLFPEGREGFHARESRTAADSSGTRRLAAVVRGRAHSASHAARRDSCAQRRQRE